MEIVVWYRGQSEVSSDELMSRLSETTAQLVDQQISNIFLVEAETVAELKAALRPDSDWTIGPNYTYTSCTSGM